MNLRKREERLDSSFYMISFWVVAVGDREVGCEVTKSFTGKCRILLQAPMNFDFLDFFLSLHNQLKNVLSTS